MHLTLRLAPRRAPRRAACRPAPWRAEEASARRTRPSPCAPSRHAVHVAAMLAHALRSPLAWPCPCALPARRSPLPWSPPRSSRGWQSLHLVSATRAAQRRVAHPSATAPPIADLAPCATGARDALLSSARRRRSAQKQVAYASSCAFYNRPLPSPCARARARALWLTRAPCRRLARCPLRAAWLLHYCRSGLPFDFPPRLAPRRRRMRAASCTRRARTTLATRARPSDGYPCTRSNP